MILKMLVKYSQTCSNNASFNWATRAMRFASANLSFSIQLLSVTSSTCNSVVNDSRHGSLSDKTNRIVYQHKVTREWVYQISDNSASMVIGNYLPCIQARSTFFSNFPMCRTAALHLFKSDSSLECSLRTLCSAVTIFSAVPPIDNFWFRNNCLLSHSF